MEPVVCQRSPIRWPTQDKSLGLGLEILQGNRKTLTHDSRSV